jgi:ribonuclease HII
MITATSKIEESLWVKGYKSICGIDEVGRGCFAGPVVAGAVIFSPECIFPQGIADSKLLEPEERERLSELIKKCAYAWAVGEIAVRDINKFGIGKATQMAFRKAIRNLSSVPDYIIFDAFYNLSKVKISSSAYIKHLSRKKQMPVKSGDKLSVSIAAASIIAKVYRDQLMRSLHKKYPDYGFAKHKGYGTRMHQEAIRKFGLTKLHRTSFNLTQFL